MNPYENFNPYATTQAWTYSYSTNATGTYQNPSEEWRTNINIWNQEYENVIAGGVQWEDLSEFIQKPIITPEKAAELQRIADGWDKDIND